MRILLSFLLIAPTLTAAQTTEVRVVSDKDYDWDQKACRLKLYDWNVLKNKGMAGFYCRNDNTIVFNSELNSAQKDQVIQHEMVHAKNNPAIRELNDKHPYDELEHYIEVLQSGETLSASKLSAMVDHYLVWLWDEIRAYHVDMELAEDMKVPHKLFNHSNWMFQPFRVPIEGFSQAYLWALENEDLRAYRNSKAYVKVRERILHDNEDLIDPWSFF
jgi:hypothetical protein